MPKPRALTEAEASQTLANRLGVRLAPRLRQLATRFGIRSNRVFLVWTKWNGEYRGEGDEVELARVELLPTPKVSPETSVQGQPYSAGKLPVGQLTVDLISLRFTKEMLQGKIIPSSDEGGNPVVAPKRASKDVREEPIDFFWEIVEDGRGDTPPSRDRYRVLGEPSRNEGNVCWIATVEKSSEDRTRIGTSKIGPDPEEF